MLVANGCLTPAFQIWLIDAKIDKMLVNLSQSINELPSFENYSSLNTRIFVVWPVSGSFGGGNGGEPEVNIINTCRRDFLKTFEWVLQFFKCGIYFCSNSLLTAIIDFSQLTNILLSLVSIDQILMQVAKSCYSLADYENEINQFLSDSGDDFKFNYLAICLVRSHIKIILLWNMRKFSHNRHTFK